MSVYKIMMMDPEGRWVPAGEQEAKDQDAAITAAAQGSNDFPDGTRYAAVPSRSWKERTVRTETRVKVVLEDG